MYQRGKTSTKRIAALKWWVTSQWRIQELVAVGGTGEGVAAYVWGEAGGEAAPERVRGTPPAQLGWLY